MQQFPNEGSRQARKHTNKKTGKSQRPDLPSHSYPNQSAGGCRSKFPGAEGKVAIACWGEVLGSLVPTPALKMDAIGLDTGPLR